MVGSNTAQLRALIFEVSATMTRNADWLYVLAIKVLVLKEEVWNSLRATNTGGYR